MNFDLSQPLTMELAALEGLKIYFSNVFCGHFNSDLFNTCREAELA